MKSGIKEILGKRVRGVVVKESKGNAPASSVFLIFDDGTYFELWGDVHGAGGVDRGGEQEVRAYGADRLKIVAEYLES